MFKETKYYKFVIDDSTGKLHHAVGKKGTPLYPYVKSKYGGWDNACNKYTLDYFLRKVRQGTCILM